MIFCKHGLTFMTNLSGAKFNLIRALALSIFAIFPFSASFAQSISSLSFTPTTVVGGLPTTGTVTISKKAPAGGFSVALSSSASCASVPSNVTVASGTTRATFYVSTIGVTNTQSAKLTASASNTAKSTNLTVSAAALSSITLSPTSVVGGDLSIGTVKLTGIAPPTGATVALTSTSKVVTLPSNVVVPSGSTTANFLFSTTGVSTNSIATITGKLGSSSKNANLTITPAELGDLTLSPNAVVGGTSSTVTVTLTGTAPTGGLPVSIAVSSPSVCIAPSSIVIPAGTSSSSFGVTTMPITASTSVVIAVYANGVGISERLSILAPHLGSVNINPNTVVGGSLTIGTVTLSAPAPMGGCTVSLSSNSAHAVVPSSVVVPAGSTTSSFVIATSVVSSNLSASISASLAGSTQTTTLGISISGVLANSAWPKFHGNAQNTGLGFGAGANGALKWSYTTGSLIGASSPSIGSDGTIYIGSWDQYLYALNTNGTLKWKFLTSSTIYSSPTIASDGTIYITSTDGNFYAVHPNGTLSWQFATGGFSNSAPAIGTDGTIYIPSLDHSLYALTPSGSMKWSFNLGNVSGASPAIGPDGTVFLPSDDEFLYAIRPDGSLKWAYYAGAGIATVSVGSDGTVYEGSEDNHLSAIDSTGNLKWKFTAGDWVNTCPAIGSDGTIYAGSRDHNLYALRPDGTLKWKYATGDQILDSSPSIGSDGTVYFGSADHYLYAINSSGSLKWRYLAGGWVDSSPAIGVDGTIYVGCNDGTIYAIR